MAWQNIASGIDRIAVDTFADESLPVVYTPAGGSATPIVAAFDAATEVVSVVEGLEVVSKQPTLRLHLSDLATAPKGGDTLTVAGVAYEVEQVEQDSAGVGALLILLRDD